MPTPTPTKVNLGVGVYYDDNGKIPLLAAVKAAEKARLEAMPPRGYQPIEGLAAYNQARAEAALRQGFAPARRTAASITARMPRRHRRAQGRRRLPEAPAAATPRSTSATRAGKTTAPCSKSAGFTVENYPYYDADHARRQFRRHEGRLDGLPAKRIVVLHACCHNPTGADLTAAQWAEVVDAIERTQSRRLHRHGLPGLRRRHRAGRRRARPVRRLRPAVLRLQLLLQVLLALWRARRRAVHRHRQQGRSRPACCRRSSA